MRSALLLRVLLVVSAPGSGSLPVGPSCQSSITRYRYAGLLCEGMFKSFQCCMVVVRLMPQPEQRRRMAKYVLIGRRALHICATTAMSPCMKSPLCLLTLFEHHTSLLHTCRTCQLALISLHMDHGPSRFDIVARRFRCIISFPHTITSRLLA